MREQDPAAAIVVADTHSRFKRAALAIAGLVATLAPAIELGPAILRAPWPAGIAFAVILIGAASVGLSLLASGLWGDSTLLTIGDGAIRLRRANCFRRWSAELGRSDIADVAVRTVQWDASPDSYAVEIRLRDGARVGSQYFPDREGAERLRHDILAALEQG